MTDRFSKTVAIKATDDDEMTATGVVLTPYELDRQLDWLDDDGIRNFYAADVNDGVMHAAFPDGDAELDRNEVLDEAETIDGVEFDAGDWVVRRQYHDSQRWALVKSGALSSFSIGGTVERAEEVDSVADIPDEVAIPASVDPETVPEKHWPPSKLIEGTVDEISDVDMGAVPSADHAVVKGLDKSPLDSVNSEEEFVAMMRQRGTMNEDQAREAWRYMETAGNEPAESGADSPDKDAMSNTDTDDEPTHEDASKVDDVGEVDDATLGARIKSAFGLGAAGTNTDDAGNAVEDSDRDAEKVGRTLSAQNRDEAKAMHDHAERLLQRAGVDEPNGMARTYHGDTRDEFSLAQYADDHDKYAPAGETADEDTMTDEELNEKVDSLEAKVDELTEKLDDDAEDETADDSEKADEQTDDNDELHEKLDDLTDTVDALDDRIDKVAKGAADTDQIEGAAAGEESEKTSEAEAFKAALGGN